MIDVIKIPHVRTIPNSLIIGISKTNYNKITIVLRCEIISNEYKLIKNYYTFITTLSGILNISCFF